MIYTIEKKGFKNVTSKAGKDFTFTTLKLVGDEREFSCFVQKEHQELREGGQADLIITPGKYEDTWMFAMSESLDGKVFRIFELLRVFAFDLAAVKVALQISDVPKKVKPRAYKTDDQKTQADVVTAKVEKDLEDIDTKEFPWA